MRGSRVQAVSIELSGERIDIIMWNEDPAQFVINSMSPAEVLSIVVDEEKKSMDIAVAEEQLSQAIGRGGQNVRLASELSGWNLNVMSKEEAEKKNTEENIVISDFFMNELHVDQDVAEILAKEGFTTVDEIAYCAIDELSSVEDFDSELVDELRKRAAEKIKEKESKIKEESKLSNLKGIKQEMIEQLNLNNIYTREDLADLSTDELLEMIELPKEEAGKIIMDAREPWYEETKD